MTLVAEVLSPWSFPSQIKVTFSDKSFGDLSGKVASRDEVVKNRLRLWNGQWNWVNQVHGNKALVLEQSSTIEGQDADALVTDQFDQGLGIFSADCAPVAFASLEGILAIAHGGWRGLVGGILENTVQKMRSLGASNIEAFLGPCIHFECYEFGDEIEILTQRLGPQIIGLTKDSKKSLNIEIAVETILNNIGVKLVGPPMSCTSCDSSFFSYRKHKDNSRQAMVVWKDSKL